MLRGCRRSFWSISSQLSVPLQSSKSFDVSQVVSKTSVFDTPHRGLPPRQFGQCRCVRLHLETYVSQGGRLPGFRDTRTNETDLPGNIWEARPFRATLLQALRRACHIHRKHLPYILRVLCSRNVNKVAHSSVLRKYHIVWQQLCMLSGQSTGNIVTLFQDSRCAAHYLRTATKS